LGVNAWITGFIDQVGLDFKGYCLVNLIADEMKCPEFVVIMSIASFWMMDIAELLQLKSIQMWAA
jgi:hypothetical protein